MSDSKVVFDIDKDGDVTINARKMIGTEEELEGLLKDLAQKELGGELKIEKHIEHGHDHHHDHGRERTRR